MPPAIERPLPIRVRPDLVVQPLEFAGRRYYGLKDPLTLKYFQLREEEYAILQMLDGEVSLEGIRRQFERQFAPKRLSAPQLQAFLGMLHHEGLVFSESSGQSTQILKREAEQRRKRIVAAAVNPLAIRFRGIDPEPLLARLAPFVQWAFTPWATALAALLILSAATLVVVRLDVLLSRMPEFQAFFGIRNVFWLAVTLGVTKILHELGHALTCRRHGGECHELGVMLLVFTPALYCNVSDAWMMPGKWQRIAVSAAGIVVELCLASVATWLWWFSEPGVLNTVCLNVMFVCSTTTLLFNGNPLLRYDGYYVLSDLIEVPNLREQSQAVVQQWLGRFFLGMDLHSERMLPPQGHLFLFTFGVAAAIYRWVVLFGILWFVHLVLKSWRLEVLAQWIAIVTVGGQLMSVTLRSARFVADTARRERVDWRRFWLRGTAAAIVVAAILLVPLSYPLSAPVVVQPRDASRTYVTVPGKIKKGVAPGQAVRAGDTLAELDSPEVRIDVVKLTGEKARLELRLEQLRVQQGFSQEAAGQLEVTRQLIEDVNQRLAERNKDLERLKIVAPVAGTVLPARDKQERPQEGDLRTWSGDPLDVRNRGAWLQAGTMLCLVGQPRQFEALLVIDQTDVDLIGPGQRVRLHLDEYPGRVVEGTITEIAQVELKTAPSELAVQGDLATKSAASGSARPRSTSYQARVRLTDAPANLTSNASGWGTIAVAPQSLATLVGRYLSRTFRFEAVGT